MDNGKSSTGVVWLTKKEATKYIGGSKRAMEYYMQEGRVRFYRLRGKVLFDRDELDEDIKGKRKN